MLLGSHVAPYLFGIVMIELQVGKLAHSSLSELACPPQPHETERNFADV
jgi:hypothetical protein